MFQGYNMCESVSQRIRQSQGQSLLFNNLGTSLIIQSWRVRYKICYILKICQYIPFGLAALFELIEEELNGGGVISMCSCTEYQKFIILLIHEAIKTYVPLRKLKTNITYFSYEYVL
ncbi:hypothetical protein Anas_13821 [Armadillidium nasatum]|uniref:Uncharacterized protein n=1 Tax=Armadillidium nasatum TaxID=96803 RepID=A0A5N5T7Z1_9CRUS|nr:hypothetical protein Anas_13821 [Armadillidium nasatum]